MDAFVPYSRKDGYPKQGMQVTLEGGPRHGEVIQWPDHRPAVLFSMFSPMLAGLDSATSRWEDSPIVYSFPIRKVVYELDRWNEARTAGIAKCIDDGKCKDPDGHARLGKMQRDMNNRLRADWLDTFVEAVASRICSRCYQPEAFEVRPRA
jgi:hypothetical protein